MKLSRKHAPYMRRPWAAALLCVLMVLAGSALAGCENDESSQVAAEICGESITEDAVSDYIATYRQGIQCTDDEAWASYLQEKELTAEDVRKSTIYELASPIVIKDKAEELGIEADESVVEERLQGMRTILGIESDEDWEAELERYGTDESQLRERYEYESRKEQVFDELTQDITATEKDTENYVVDNLAGQTTKKLVCFYGQGYSYLSDVEAAIQNASSIEAGVKAAEKLVNDANVFKEDLGWDIDVELTDSMRSEISSLSKGEVSDAPLADSGYYYIFYVEDAYTFPKKASKLMWKDSTLKKKVENLATESVRDAAGSVWLQQQVNSLITINDMPEGLAYDVALPESTDDSQSSGADADSDTSGH